MNYKDLNVWKHGRDLAICVCRITAKFPSNKARSLVFQIEKSAVSVPSNIAEGNGRQYKKENVQFLYIARGSLLELETQCEIAFGLGYINKEDYNLLTEKINGCGKLITGFINYLRKNNSLR